MTELSPQAQAILDAYNAGFARPVAVHHKPRIAAALEAVADQMVPKEWPTIEDYNEYEQGVAAAHIKHRNQILAIANELKSV